MSTTQTERTRAAILGSARRLIEADPHGWTMEAVADAAGMTRMTVYRYFPSRSELVVATARHVDLVEGAADRFARACGAGSGVAALRAWVRVWTDYLPHIAPLARALLSARADDEAAARAWEDRMADLRRGPRLIVEQLDGEGALSDHLPVEAAADLMWAIASVQVWDALTRERGWTSEQYERHLADALERALTGSRRNAG